MRNDPCDVREFGQAGLAITGQDRRFLGQVMLMLGVKS